MWKNAFLKQYEKFSRFLCNELYSNNLRDFGLKKGLDHLDAVRQLKGHGLLERDGPRYAYRLTDKGVHMARLFLFFHKRLCGPLANRRFHHRPHRAHRPNSKLEAAYHKADKAIQNVVDLLAAA